MCIRDSSSKGRKIRGIPASTPAEAKKAENMQGACTLLVSMSFSVACPSCGKSFQLAQEIYDRKVAGKVVSIKCKQCQVGIRIDATQPGELKVLGATPVAGGAESIAQQPPPAAAKQAQAAAPAGGAMRARQPTLLG